MSARAAPVVMVVEDEADFRLGVTDLLGDAGYGVVSAGDGFEALRLLQERPLPAVIMLDLSMPVMSGWQLRQHLLHDMALRSIPVVVMTAYPVKPFLVDAVVAKPALPWQLLLAVEHALLGAGCGDAAPLGHRMSRYDAERRTVAALSSSAPIPRWRLARKIGIATAAGGILAAGVALVSSWFPGRPLRRRFA